MAKKKDEKGEKEEILDSNEQTTEGTEVSNEEAGPEQKMNELQDKYVRLYSDFDNFRKRTIKEKADIISSASAGVIKELLEVLDDFERAIENNEKVEDINTLREGFKLIYNKTKHILEVKGLEAMSAKGEIFDPEIHEAITNIPVQDAKDKGKVVDVIEKGYNLNGKPLRYAKVVVGQ